ncbi:MAG: NADH-quinone oxidoreductase subunit NuoH [Acidobacteria bacterium]|nr:NADH-quinone oxidoreductase subunit NuoH [Acidobacteriota bacterium]MCL5286796.1 NADH-quinone oxidoreductase subunit NuoH [Acidobacteriota bacterium]
MSALLEFLKTYMWPLIFAVVIVAVLPLLAGYVVLMERKIMADMQARLGPMRVGPHGLLQPIADALKLLIKEDIIPENADKVVFWFAPVISVTAAMLAYSALAIGPFFQIAELNIGLLFIVAVSSMGIFGIILGGWASNSHYSLLGALRSTAQMISYETAAGLALVGGVLLAGSLSTREIVQAQHGGTWYVFVAPIGFFLYLVASIAETNRAPFDLPEAESELVAGYMTEYSGFRWAVYFLAEYANMIVVASIATTLFLGGWLRPFQGTPWMDFLDFFPPLCFLAVAGYCFYRTPKQPEPIQSMVMALFGGLCLLLAAAMALPFVPAFAASKPGLHGAFWFLLKVSLYIYSFMWIRFTFPRFRFDQLMKLGWYFMIPLSIVNVLGLGVYRVLRQLQWSRWPAFVLTTGGTLLVAIWLVWNAQKKAAAPSSVGDMTEAEG